MDGPVGAAGAAASFALVAVAAGISWWRGIGVERSVLWAALRAAVQLLAVGALFAIIFTAALAQVWAWTWVVIMVGVAAETARRRAPAVPRLRYPILAALAASVGVGLAVVFGFGVLQLEPVTLVVIAGITVGNTMPAAVLAVDQVAAGVRDRRSEVEGLLALGFDAKGATRFLVRMSARTAMTPQIERTKVVGIIALPGAMTGLLLAGVDPVDAVLVQLVVMYLILGSVAVTVLVIVSVIAGRALTSDLRVADWTTP